MKFRISRVSGYGIPKVAGVKIERVIWFDRRSVSTLEEARKQPWSEEFFSGGSNHREENGRVVRDLPATIYTIEIESLKDLLQFIERVGSEIILDNSSYKEVAGEILVYDDYLE